MGSFNYARHRRSIERLYDDRVTIRRFVEIEKPSGETALSKEPVPIYEEQPCRISQKSLAVNGQTEAQNNISYETKLFISPDVEIRQGDQILVSRQGVVRTYTAGEPFLYPTHQEISLQRKEHA